MQTAPVVLGAVNLLCRRFREPRTPWPATRSSGQKEKDFIGLRRCERSEPLSARAGQALDLYL